MNDYICYIRLVTIQTVGNLKLGLIYTHYASTRFSQAVGVKTGFEQLEILKLIKSSSIAKETFTTVGTKVQYLYSVLIVH